MVSLPIPTSVKAKQNSLIVKYYPNNLIKSIIEFNIDIDLQSSRGSDLIQVMTETIDEYNNPDGTK